MGGAELVYPDTAIAAAAAAAADRDKRSDKERRRRERKCSVICHKRSERRRGFRRNRNRGESVGRVSPVSHARIAVHFCQLETSIDDVRTDGERAWPKSGLR